MLGSELRFDGRVAIVTGSSKGIGHATVKLLAARGARVVVSGRNPEPVESTVEEIVAAGGEAIGNVGDVSNREHAEALVQQTTDHYGRLDIVVNNAGILDYATFPDMPAERFWNIMAVNLGGAFNVSQAAWPHMAERRYGRILVLPSQGIYGSVYVTHYSSSKAALFGFMRTLSLEGREHGINVNAVIPFAFTPMMQDVIGSGTPIADQGADALSLTPEALAPELVAPTIGWFAHETCEVTGEMVHVGAGRVARVFMAECPGLIAPGHTMETVRDRWPDVCREPGYTVPGSFADSLSNLIESVGRHAEIDAAGS